MPGSELNRQQRLASAPDKGESLVVAGAGTGKTRILVEKARNIIAAGDIGPENILILTFSRKAAGEIKERIKSYIGAAADSITSGTFHSFCLGFLRGNPGLFQRITGFTSVPDVLDEDAGKKLKSDLIKCRIDKFLGLPESVICGLSMDTGKCDRKTLEKLKRLGILGELDMLNKRFSEEKRAKNLIDFQDMINCAVSILESDKEIRERTAARYRYIFVDEFQDTAEDNFRLLQLILPEKNPNLFLVGDDWQSIYGFRGSRIDYIIRAKRFFPSITVRRLEMNYRSRSEIVKISNSFIRKNRRRTIKKLKSRRGRGGTISDYQVRSHEEEIGIIRDILRKDPGAYSSTAILYRNNWQGGLISKKIDDLSPAKSGLLHLSTMHGSKGLEFDNVIIAGISDDIIPDESNDIEEERRLMYVALTRARESLHIIHHRPADREISIFAGELGLSGGRR